jgi:hypothetical protein
LLFLSKITKDTVALYKLWDYLMCDRVNDATLNMISIGRADIEGSKSNVAYPCGNFYDTPSLSKKYKVSLKNTWSTK